MEEAEQQAAMSQEEKIQHAEELYARKQLADAELGAMRIKIAVQEEFDRLQANGQEGTPQEVDVQEVKSPE